jgi:hypothetical protein
MLPLASLNPSSRSSRRTEFKEKSSGSHDIESDVCPNRGSDSTASPSHESENDTEQQQRWELQGLKVCGCKEGGCGEDCSPWAKTTSEYALRHPSEIDLFRYRGSDPHNEEDKHYRQRIICAISELSGRSRHIVHAKQRTKHEVHHRHEDQLASDTNRQPDWHIDWLHSKAKVGNNTLALLDCEPNWRGTKSEPQRDLHKRSKP